VVLAEQRASIEGDSDGCCIILNESGVDDRWLMIVAVSTLAGLCKGPNGEPGALDGLSDVLRAELLTLTLSGSVRLAHWRARRHDVRAELYAWLNREYARLGPYRRGREGEREQHALTRRAALPLESAD